MSIIMRGIAGRLATSRKATTQCAWCGKVKSEGDYTGDAGPLLQSVEGRNVTHGICPSCLDSLVANMRGTWDRPAVSTPSRGSSLFRI